MDKSRLLQRFAELAVAESLDFDAIRLYLLLLAAGDESGEGTIDRSSLRSALQQPPVVLEAACRALADRKLIVLLRPPGLAIGQPVLYYRLLPVDGDET